MDEQIYLNPDLSEMKRQSVPSILFYALFKQIYLSHSLKNYYLCTFQQGVAAQLDQIMNSDIDKHGLLKPLLADQPHIPSTILSKYRTRAKDIVMSSVFPAFQELKEYLEKVNVLV